MGRCLDLLCSLLDALFLFGHFSLPYSLFAIKAIMEASWFLFSVWMWAEIKPNQAIILPKEKETHAECNLQNRDDSCSGLISSIWWPAHHQNREGFGCYHCSDKCHFPVPCCHAVLEGSSSFFVEPSSTVRMQPSAGLNTCYQERNYCSSFL